MFVVNIWRFIFEVLTKKFFSCWLTGNYFPFFFFLSLLFYLSYKMVRTKEQVLATKHKQDESKKGTIYTIVVALLWYWLHYTQWTLLLKLDIATIINTQTPSFTLWTCQQVLYQMWRWLSERYFTRYFRLRVKHMQIRLSFSL